MKRLLMNPWLWIGAQWPFLFAGIFLSPWFYVGQALSIAAWAFVLWRNHKRETREDAAKAQRDMDEIEKRWNETMAKALASSPPTTSGYTSAGLITPYTRHGIYSPAQMRALLGHTPTPALEAPNGSDRRTPARVRSASTYTSADPGTGQDSGEGNCASLIGYRRWKLNEQGFLTGISVDDLWCWGVNHFVCRCGRYSMYLGSMYLGSMFGIPEASRSHDKPVIGSECGYWAHSSPPTGIKNGSDFVWGAVELWGAVVEHEHGWRAEYARIVALVGHKETADRYQAASFTTLKGLVSEFPPTMLEVDE